MCLKAVGAALVDLAVAATVLAVAEGCTAPVRDSQANTASAVIRRVIGRRRRLISIVLMLAS